MRLLIFTKYSATGPSSRYRHYQYLSSYLNNFDTHIFPFFSESYNYQYNNIVAYLNTIKSIIIRFYCILFFVRKDDLLIIEYELLPYFPPLLEKYLLLKKIKYILDYDDAIFHNYNQSKKKLVKCLFSNKIKNISAKSNYIITGSPYLTKYFSKYNCNIIEIPTSINFNLYQSRLNKKFHTTINIGWLGSSTTSKNLVLLKNVFLKLKSKYKNNIRILFCGFNNSLSNHFNEIDFEIIDWTSDNEFEFLNSIDIGIMPLENNDFNKGKCGFKLIQYMAFGIPTISYPFEANIKIDHNNGNLFARNEAEWYNSFVEMIDNIHIYNKVGFRNIEIVKNHYSIEANTSKYIDLIKNLINVNN